MRRKPRRDAIAGQWMAAMAQTHQPTILFCGKHRVNFALFQPAYRLLRQRGEVRLFVSSGRYRNRGPLGWWAPHEPELLNERLFAEFDIDPAHLHTTSIADIRDIYDVYVSSNVDEKLIPQYARARVQIFQGVSFRNFAVHEKYLAFDKLFFIGRYHLEQYLRRGLLREDDPRIELIGMPKLDCLVDGSIDRESVLRGLELDPALPTVLWCPTGARHNGFETLGHAGLRAIESAGADTGGLNVILKLHDHPHLPKGMTYEDVVNHARAGLGERCRLAAGSDVAPLLVAADLLVTDASSVAYEFCIRDRPIVFVDVPQLIQARAASDAGAMDLETHGRKVGRIAAGAEALTETIRAELAEPGGLGAERRAAAAHLFHEPGGAAARMADRLTAMATEAAAERAVARARRRRPASADRFPARGRLRDRLRPVVRVAYVATILLLGAVAYFSDARDEPGGLGDFISSTTTLYDPRIARSLGIAALVCGIGLGGVALLRFPRVRVRSMATVLGASAILAVTSASSMVEYAFDDGREIGRIAAPGSGVYSVLWCDDLGTDSFILVRELRSDSLRKTYEVLMRTLEYGGEPKPSIVRPLGADLAGPYQFYASGDGLLAWVSDEGDCLLVYDLKRHRPLNIDAGEAISPFTFIDADDALTEADLERLGARLREPGVSQAAFLDAQTLAHDLRHANANVREAAGRLLASMGGQ